MGRVEAAHLILEVFRRVGIPWDREIKPLRGWEGRGQKAGYGPMRLSKLLWRKYTLGISPNTIKAILRRHGQRRKRRRVRRGSRPLYDYEHLLPFEEMQVLLRMDFGSEFCGPPPKKQRQWREPGTSSGPTLGGGWGEGHLWKSSRSDQGGF